MAELDPGTQLAGCRIEAVAGRGGMGVVYRATQLDLDRPVAVKLIAPQHAADPDFRRRFEREARLTASIDHPNVIPIYAAGEEAGRLYLVMRYVAGTDLHRLLRERTRLAPLRTAVIVAQVADALDAAHAAGLVHRDVKPANVLIAGRHVYLSDFGITRDETGDTVITDSGGWIGSVDYMSPEHLDARPTDARSDVYALGCVLFATLTGAPPFHRDTVPATISAHMRAPIPRPSELADVPAAFDAIVARALAKAPAERYASAGELGRAALSAAGVAASVRAGAGRAGGAAGANEDASADGPHAPAEAPAPSGEPAGPAAGAPARPDEPAARAAGAVSPSEPPLTAPTRHAPSTVVQPPDAPDPPQQGNGAAVAGVAAPADHPRRRARGRSRRRAAAATALVVLLGAGAATAAALGVGVFEDDGPPSGPLQRDEVERLANAFARAYASEDSGALRRLLTPGVRRVAPDSIQDGRGPVVAEYRRQFGEYAVRDYVLRGLKVSGGAVGRADSRYLVLRRDRPTIAGRLVLGVVRDRTDRPRIALIAAEPRG